MGSNVLAVPNTQKAGYEDLAFELTIKNDSSEPIQDNPTKTSYMVWRGTDGRTDSTLAYSATDIYSSQIAQHGITGEDLGLLTGGVPGNGYARGYITLLVPTSPGAVILHDPNTYTPVLLINYKKLPTDQVNALKHGLQNRQVLQDETFRS